MVRLTRMNGKPVVLNADLIVSVESTPDTLVTLMNGDRIRVLEPVERVVAAAVEYQRHVRAHGEAGAQGDGDRQAATGAG